MTRPLPDLDPKTTALILIDLWERNYQLLLVEDVMAARAAEDHTFAITRVFPRLGRICGTEDVLKVWEART